MQRELYRQCVLFCLVRRTLNLLLIKISCVCVCVRACVCVLTDEQHNEAVATNRIPRSPEKQCQYVKIQAQTP